MEHCTEREADVEQKQDHIKGSKLMCFEATEAEGCDVCPADHQLESTEICLKVQLYGTML